MTSRHAIGKALSSSFEQRSSSSSTSLRITPSRQTPPTAMAQQQEVLDTSLSATEPSPMRKKRIEEKEELAHLNDRFLEYIQQVRRMKDVNIHLETELHTVREQLGKEAESVKQLYEAELSDARTLIDETAKEKARQQILNSKSVARIDELEAELKAVQGRLDGLEAQLAAAERAAASSEAQRRAMADEKNRFQKQAKDLEHDVAELQAQIVSLRESMEAETLSKVDLQNNIQSLREELAFRKKIYEEELASLHSKLEKTTVESVDLGHLLDSRLEAAIEELRDKSETEIAQYKLEVEATYKDKIAILEGQSKKDVTAISRINTELHRMMSSLGDSSSEISRLQKSNEKMASILRSKEEELVSARQSHTEEVSKLVAELRGLRESYETKIREYEELMDIRIQLDQEIATYQALLHEEETRLHITVTPPREKRRSLRVPMSEPVPKRPRLHQQQQGSSPSPPLPPRGSYRSVTWIHRGSLCGSRTCPHRLRVWGSSRSNTRWRGAAKSCSGSTPSPSSREDTLSLCGAPRPRGLSTLPPTTSYGRQWRTGGAGRLERRQSLN
ncbi:Lamin-C [Geodia barretti]|uniref:Lamin-C n=1 Tax=Geodia barretti TaxID=519541 RepID=A0AA35W9J9_GEOBA|nr:Lamin-C [Geodia barretti]